MATPILADALIDPATVHREVLPNGLTVLVRPDRSAPVVAINTYVKAGYFDETDDVVGIAHVLEHMFFKGTDRRGVGEIAKETKSSGGYLNAHTIYDHTSYYAVLPASGFAAGLDVQADAYAHSVVDAAELAKELEVIIQEAKRKLDNPGAVTIETLYALLHDRHRIRRWRIGVEHQLRGFRRDDVVRFYRNFYRPRNTVLAIVGDVDVDDAVARARRLYGALDDAPIARAPGEHETAPPGVRYRELTGDVGQSHLAFGWRTPGTLDDDTPRLDLAAGVLGTGRGSRLYRAVRERGLASSVGAYDSTPTEIGVFTVHLELPPERAADAARAAWSQVAALRDDGVSAAEVERVQRVAESRWLRRLETMEGQASHLCEWEALGDWTLGDRYLERLLGATPEEVTDAARRHLDPDAFAAIYYRPTDAPALAADAEALRSLLDAAEPAPLAAPRRAPYAPAAMDRAPRHERVECGVHVYRTDAGVPILVRPKPGAAVAHLGAYALGGAVDERDAEAGLTSLVARTAVKGTTTRSAAQIAEDAELLGGSVGASAGGESFGWGISVPRKHLAAAAALLADVVQHPTFPDTAFDTERGVALSELAMLRDDMYRYPLRLALGAAYPGHPYGRAVVGTEESLRALDAERARAWHRSQVVEGATVLAVVGDVDPDEAAAALAREFGALVAREAERVAAPTWPAEARQAVEHRDKAQSALAMVFPGPARRDPDRFTAQLLAGIASGLGGRFFDELRDRRSLAYTVHVFASPRALGGSVSAYIATSPEREAEAREGLLEELAKIRDGGVTAEELQRAQTYAIGTHQIHQQSGGAVLGEIIDAWLFGDGLAELDEFAERVRAVTPEAVRSLVARYCDPDVRVEGVVRGTGKS
ncbi:peptidase M16 domain protein [Gemmatirosa kalamazoonensis]|uniref:Peptidase M16 domain protein n=1 Tax=Gemmatirosa kalamazoonensis TaxID=861299 RepID=W0RL06_9BACT|nr:pitrilysin family protein [Gemmatirosa kalamazoonensis]AHG91744.1 peptidase M16 domain protein [Gemmatirosa kalamazoonensis]